MTSIVLNDISVGGKKKPWKKHKINSLKVAESFYLLRQDERGEKVLDCGERLTFSECPQGHQKKLAKANFCRQRLCPMCTWRKANMIASQVCKVAHAALEENPTYSFLLLTLTVPNVSGIELNNSITHLLESFKRLVNYPEAKKVIKGSFRALEVVYSAKRDDYHPHFHVLLFVPASYFTKNYIKHERWLELWRKATGMPEITQVDIRKIKSREGKNGSLGGAAAEVAKYSTKASDFCDDKNVDTDRRNQVIKILQKALFKRRLISYGGLLKDIHSRLNLLDVEQASSDDLVNAGEEESKCKCPVCQSELQEVVYLWTGRDYERMVTGED